MVQELMTLPEFVAKYNKPVDYIVEQFLALGGLSAIFADPKAGKSTLVRNLIQRVSHGEPFFGRATREVPILYYVLEESPTYVSEMFQRMGELKKHVYIREGGLTKESILRVLKKDITTIDAQLAIVDPLFDMIVAADVNAYGIINEAMKAVLHVARETQCHIMVTHHTNKGTFRGGRSALGSQAITGATDHNAFLVVRKDNVRLFSSQSRGGKAFDPAKVEFDEATQRVWLANTEVSSRLDTLCDRMLEALGDHALTTTEWRTRVEGRNSDKTLATQQLYKDGRIVAVVENNRKTWQRVTV